MQENAYCSTTVTHVLKKKEFDVTMLSCDGEEVCELVGLFLLSKHGSVIVTKNVGLYKDERLSSSTLS